MPPIVDAVASGAKVGQFYLLCIVNVGPGADNPDLGLGFFGPAVELAFSSPSIRKQHQVPVSNIVINGNVDDQVFAHIGVEIQILALYGCHGVSRRLCVR